MLALLALWSTLQSGPWQPAFASSWVVDPARVYGTAPDSPGPVLAQVWYPSAQRPATGMTYGQYLDPPPLAEFPNLPRRLNQLFRQITPLPERLFTATTRACRECRPAAERFPVILYHPGAGGAFHENTVLFEYLASHGYAVVSSAFQPSESESLSNNTTQLATSIEDLRVLIRYAATLPFADTTRIGAAGHSMGAQFMLQWLGERDMPVGAFVSLDSTLEYTPRNFPGHKELRDRLRELWPPRIPVLLFARAADRPNFRTYDEFLRHAPRYEAAVQSLRHDDFTLHGIVQRDTPRVREAYNQVCRTMLQFFDCRLKGDKTSCSLLRTTGPVALEYRAPAR